jgi:hypothetical protein
MHLISTFCSAEARPAVKATAAMMEVSNFISGGNIGGVWRDASKNIRITKKFLQSAAHSKICLFLFPHGWFEPANLRSQRAVVACVKTKLG